MKITTAAEMREIDRRTSERFGVHSLTLMENAGAAVANFAREHFAEASRIAIVCGKGNNGGDGFVAARKLHQAGKVVEVLLLADPAELRGDAAKDVRPAADAPGCHRQRAGTDERAYARAGQCRPDCRRHSRNRISSSGYRPLRRGHRGHQRHVRPVLAVDIPSGADSDALTAQAGTIARADAIVTFTAPRPAHLFGNLSLGPSWWPPSARPRRPSNPA